MTAVTIIPYGTAKEVEIEAIERKLGNRFPEDYRKFLLTSNGGKPYSPEGKDIAFPIRWKHQPWTHHFQDTVLRHLDSASGPTHPLKWAKDDRVLAQIRQYMPNDTVPIGEDWGGNPILLGVSGANRGKVFYWASEFAPTEDDTAPGYSNVGLIAESFDEFLRSLYVLPNED